MERRVTLLRWRIARLADPSNNKRRAPIPARAAIFQILIGDYWSPPMKPEIFQPPPSLL